MFWSPAGLKKIKKFKFYGNLFQTSPFLLKRWAKRPLGHHLSTPGWQKYFFKLPGYENPMLGRRIFDLSSFVKKKVCITKPGIWRPYWISQNILIPRHKRKNPPPPLFSKGHLELPKSTIKFYGVGNRYRTFDLALTRNVTGKLLQSPPDTSI